MSKYKKKLQPNCCLKVDFQKGGPTCRKQVVYPFQYIFSLLCQIKFVGELELTLFIMHYVNLVGDQVWSQIWYDLYSQRSCSQGEEQNDLVISNDNKASNLHGHYYAFFTGRCRQITTAHLKIGGIPEFYLRIPGASFTNMV